MQVALGQGVRLDLHDFAASRFTHYLGEQRGSMLLSSTLKGAKLIRITTPEHLMAVAEAIRPLGWIEASVAGILISHAILVQADRTLLQTR